MMAAARCLFYPRVIGWREVLSKHRFSHCQESQQRHVLRFPLVRQAHCSSVIFKHENLRLNNRNPQRILNSATAGNYRVKRFLAPHDQTLHANKIHNSGFHTASAFGKQSSDLHLAEVNSKSQLYYRILESVPGGVQMAIAYGSGVYRQVGHASTKENMLDFILVVDDPVDWHTQNLRRNPNHYSFIKRFGGHALAHIQEYGAGVYFNTLVPFEDRIIKYGIISTERLITDLLDWDTLYISGRLHKPVQLMILPTNPDLHFAMKVNLQSAVHAALLLLPEEFCEESLYVTIAGLSYNGDFRMVVGEDRNKVSNIVSPNMDHFRQLYESMLEAEEHVHWHRGQGRLEQDPNHITQHHHLQLLPKNVLMLLQENRTRPGSNPDLEEVLKIYANSSHCDDTVARCISHIVWRSSLGQSAKTILTAGARKSVVYSLKKLGKMWKGRPKKQMT